MTPGAALLELLAIMDRLRRECPWDARQTHQSLAPYLLEETYEAVEAIEAGDLAGLREELGDVLLQVVFHARVASERSDETGFDIDDVASQIAAKLVRRHPHVFGDADVTSAADVQRNWDAIKAAERSAAGRQVSALESVPLGQPALSLAAALRRRARTAGAPDDLADLPVVRGQAGPGQRARERGEPAGEPGAEPAERGEPAVTPGDAGAVSEIGAEMFALAGRAVAAGLDPELELRHAARLYRDRVLAWERDR